MVEYILRNSLQAHRTVTIIYQKGKEITQRDIRVIKLTDKDVEAFCYLRHQVRNFKKENILAAMYANKNNTYRKEMVH
jgi:predicted DNA-binding transcriptional regulator YafY